MPARQSTTSDSLIRALPDLVICVRRDGVVLALNAGDAVGALKPAADSLGRNIDAIWPDAVAELVKQLVRRAIATRSTVEARFEERNSNYEVRASAQGPDRAICVIRPATDALAETVEATAERLAPQIDRRGFLRRLKQSVSMAGIREAPLAVAIIHIDGIADIAQAIAPKVSEQLMTSAILRLSAAAHAAGVAQPGWYLGQLSDTLLALVIESADHDIIQACAEQICSSLGEPVALAGDHYHLTPSAGIAVLGQDTPSARGLLDRARAAVNEARRDSSRRIRFFTDTLGLKSLSRQDIARELHGAIANREIQLRYAGRHELATGKLLARVAYLRWQHPLRGDIRCDDFLRIAQTTGLGLTLSRAALQWLQDDCKKLDGDAQVRVSFSPLRQHLAHEELIADLERMLADGVIQPQRLELRLAASHLGVRPPEDFRSLATAGVRFIVDEVGREALSLDWLARASVHGLQLERALVLESRRNPGALRLCRTHVAVALSLGLTPLSDGVDDEEYRQALLAIGCEQGEGDLYRPV